MAIISFNKQASRSAANIFSANEILPIAVPEIDDVSESVSLHSGNVIKFLATIKTLRIQLTAFAQGSQVEVRIKDSPPSSAGDGTVIHTHGANSQILTYNKPSDVIIRDGTHVWLRTKNNNVFVILSTVRLSGTYDDTPFNFAVSIADQTWRERQTAVSLQLPLATGGTGQLGYKLEGTLPDGVSINLVTRLITGTPTSRIARTRFKWIATDETGATAELSFYITVIEPDIVPVLPTIPETTFYTAEDNRLVLPVATGGNGALTYKLYQVTGSRRVELPETSTDTEQPVFNKSTRVLSLSPTVVASSISLLYEVEDSDGDTDSESFIFLVTFRGDDTFPSFPADASIPDQTWGSGDRISPTVQLPRATGGNAPLRYRFSPALPGGVVFDRSLHQLRGVPNIYTPREQFSFIAEDANGDAATLQFHITINEPDISPEWTPGAVIADQSWTTGVPIIPLTLPEARLGNGGLVYSLSPALPDGLSFNALTRQITGTPTAPFASTEFTYTAEDRDGDQITLTFDIVVPDTTPTFGTRIANQVWELNVDIGTITLPVARSGNEPHRYELTGDLPTGVLFDPAARTLTGTPTEFLTTTQFTYTAIDADGDRVSLRFSITVPDRIPGFAVGSRIPDQTWETGITIRRVLLPQGAGGNPPLRYELTPGLPDGVQFDSVNRAIVGTPSAIFARTQFAWTVIDSDGDRRSINFFIQVPDKVPSFPRGAAVPNREFFAGDPITPFSLPRATGGNIPLRYVITPALPSGLVFDPNALVVSGTPRFEGVGIEYEYYAVDVDGSQTARLSFRLAVVERPLIFAVDTISLQRWTEGDDETLKFPAASGGDGTDIEYSVSFDRPLHGMVFDSATRELSGAPTRPGTYRGVFLARNESGAERTINFRIIVSAAPQPTYECFTSVDTGGQQTLLKSQETVGTDKTTNPEQPTDEVPVDPPITPPTTPTGEAMVSGFRVIGQFRQIRLEWENISLPAGVTFPPWEVQVSDTGVDTDPWYSLRNDGNDWKGTVNTATVISTGFYDHFIGKDNLRLWYRVRFQGNTEWSAPVDATSTADTRVPADVKGFTVLGRGWTMQLDWDVAPVDGPPIKHWEIQVSAAMGGPWYSLVNGGTGNTGWRGIQDEWTAQTANYYTHFALPIRGTDGPVSLTLYYRIRAVSEAGIKSEWTDGSHSGTAMGITKGDLAANIVDAYLIDPENFLKGFDAGLAAWWTFDESGGGSVVTDVSDRGNDLTINSARRPTSREGAAFRALEFPSAAYALRASSLSTQSRTGITVSCWVDLDSYAGTVFVWQGVELGFRGGNKIYFKVGAAEVEVTVTGLTGSWHHFCGTWDGGSDIKLYIDGIDQGGGGASRGSISGSAAVTVGALNGALDELRVYSRALEIAEVRFLTLVPGGPTPGMVIADKIIAKSITSREISTDSLEALVADLRQLVLSGRVGTEVRGRTIRTGDIETFIDNDQLIQYRALRDNPTSISHWEILTQLRSFGRESVLELHDQATRRNITLSKNGIDISGGTTGVLMEFSVRGEIEIRLTTSRYLRMRYDGLRMQHDSDTYVSLDNVNGLRVYDGQSRVDVDDDEVWLRRSSAYYARLRADYLRIQLSSTRFVLLNHSGLIFRNGSRILTMATTDDLTDFLTDSEARTVVRGLLGGYYTEDEVDSIITSRTSGLTTEARVRQLISQLAGVPTRSQLITALGSNWITTGMLRANIVRAENIVGNVFNVRKLYNGRTLGNARGGSGWYSLGRHTGITAYDLFMVILGTNIGSGTLIMLANNTTYSVNFASSRRSSGIYSFRLRTNNIRTSDGRGDLDIQIRGQSGGQDTTLYCRGVWGISSP